MACSGSRGSPSESAGGEARFLLRVEVAGAAPWETKRPWLCGAPFRVAFSTLRSGPTSRFWVFERLGRNGTGVVGRELRNCE